MEITDLQKTLLKNRNIAEDDWKNFLKPNFESGIYDPFLLPDMKKAVERILVAIEKNEKIVIYTDYDCDGIPAGVILYDFFKEIGYDNFFNYIPHRHSEGYGLHKAAIEKFALDGVKLMITADLGITNTEEVKFAEDRGINVILTDHHLPHTEIIDGKEKQIIPSAFAVINAKRDDNQYPDNMLSGCATAWKLVCALVEEGQKKNISSFNNISSGFLKWQLDMVGISTIADMVPLVNENRVLAHYGLIVLQKTRRPGLFALFKKAKIKQSEISEEDIAFSIAPRLNAASRMDNPMEAFKLLSTRDEKQAENIAAYLEELNNARKESVASHMKKAHHMAKDRLENEVLVLGDVEWGPGVLGLIASKLTDEYKKTVFVWGAGDDESSFKGSCRSDGKTHLVDLMQACTEGTFSAMGGHELAGGFSVSFEKIHELENELNKAYNKTKHNQIEAKQKTIIDGELPLFEVNKKTLDEINALAPFGEGNQRAVFLFKSVLVSEVSLFGKTKNHLKIVSNNNGSSIEFIQFFKNLDLETETGVLSIEKGMMLNIEGYIEQDTFGYKRNIRVRIVEVKNK